MALYKKVKLAEYRATRKNGSQGIYIQAPNIKIAKLRARQILGAKNVGTVKLFRTAREIYVKN